MRLLRVMRLGTSRPVVTVLHRGHLVEADRSPLTSHCLHIHTVLYTTQRTFGRGRSLLSGGRLLWPDRH
jgi:hypothetical protein